MKTHTRHRWDRHENICKDCFLPFDVYVEELEESAASFMVLMRAVTERRDKAEGLLREWADYFEDHPKPPPYRKTRTFLASTEGKSESDAGTEGGG